MKALAAANETTLPPIGPTGFFSAINPGSAFAKIIASAFPVILVVGGIWAFVMLIMGAFSIISSGGDQQKIETGRNQITWAIIGVIILAASWGLIILIEGLTGACFGFSCDVDLERLAPQL